MLAPENRGNRHASGKYFLCWITVTLNLHLLDGSWGLLIYRLNSGQESHHEAASISGLSGGCRTALLRRHCRSRVLAEMLYRVYISH